MSDTINIQNIRDEFPILNREVAGKPLIYLDNTATSQTPRCVVESIERMYYHTKANVHRGVHTLSQEATDLVEGTREKVRKYINAQSTEEIIFTRGTTEAINLVAASYGEKLCNGDEIMLSRTKTHDNIVTRQLIKRHPHIICKIFPMKANGELMLDV